MSCSGEIVIAINNRLVLRLVPLERPKPLVGFGAFDRLFAARALDEELAIV